MATHMILPGGWAGGWQGRQVAQLFEQAGRTVVSPAFADLERPAGTVSTGGVLHARIRETLELIQRKDLHDLILVSFNLSGEVATELARLAPERIARLVYVDALLAQTCQSFTNSATAPAVSAGAAHVGQAVWCLQNGSCGEAWPDPGSFAPARALGCSYIRCTAGSAFANWTAPASYTARAAGWDYCELPLDHASRSATPEEVAGQLLALG